MQRSVPSLSRFLSSAFVTTLVAMGGLLSFASTASALPQPATGATSIYLSSFDTLTGALGLTVTPLGLDTGAAELTTSGLLPSPTVSYGVTAVDLTTVEIFHDGIGLQLSAGPASVVLENFVVDGANLTITADVTTAISAVVATAPVFDLIDCRATPGFCVGLDGTTSADGLGLFLTDTEISVLSGEFGGSALTGVTTATPIGVANSIFTVIPEPSTALLLGGGLVLLAGQRRPRD
ncbi:MAG: PEP-CTERM sorting domain-containing protein [Myxococcota bacterium]